MYTLTAGLLAIYNCYKAAGFTMSRTLAFKLQSLEPQHFQHYAHILGPVLHRIDFEVGYVITVT